MLGARTKQVNSYGKRNRRIVDISGDPTARSVSSIFDDIPPAPKLVGIASKMKSRENVAPSKVAGRTPSPKVFGVYKQKRFSPFHSPSRKKHAARVAQTLQTEVQSKFGPMKSGGLCKPDSLINSKPPSRAPLSTFPINLPSSPAVSSMPNRARKPRVEFGKAHAPFKPFVDVDIIVLDDEGKTITTERRVSRTSVQPNVKEKARDSPMSVVPREDTDDSESEPVRPKYKLQGRRLRTIVLSDDSDQGDDVDIPPKSAAVAKKIMASKPLSSSNRPNLRLKVEVVVPPAPYQIHSSQRGVSQNLYEKPISQASNNQISTHPIKLSPKPYEHIPSPKPPKPRQLTPIRGKFNRGIFNPPSPPSPTTPTDFDLSIDFEELNISAHSQDQGDNITIDAIPEYLKPLLDECGQDSLYEFSAFIETFPYDPIIQAGKISRGTNFRKIGEASYSEVFGIGDVVLKVIPLRDESTQSISASNNKDSRTIIDGPAPSDVKDVRKEIIVTRAMGAVNEGFVKLLKTYVVRGRYPEVLLKLWDDFDEKKGSESVRPDTFSVSQLYAIIVLPNGGPDLEEYTFVNPGKSGWKQACSLFWQVAKILTHAERLVSFEHRDLHWGQILVRNLPKPDVIPLKTLANQRTKSKPGRLFMDDFAHGVQATIIDLGLSRMDAGDGSGGNRVHWTPFDEEIFMGEGDYQFDVYRIMRHHCEGAWEEFKPLTNVLWLHYLCLKLLTAKNLKPPRKPRGTPDGTIQPFTEKECYDCLVDIENWLASYVASLMPTKSKGKGKRKAPVPDFQGPACAGEIVAYGAKKGWITSA